MSFLIFCPDLCNVSSSNKFLKLFRTIEGLANTANRSYLFVFISIIYIVMIISFLALLILIDTFKTLIYQIFPGLENYLFSFFEVLKDIMLFINDLF